MMAVNTSAADEIVAGTLSAHVDVHSSRRLWSLGRVQFNAVQVFIVCDDVQTPCRLVWMAHRAGQDRREEGFASTRIASSFEDQTNRITLNGRFDRSIHRSCAKST